MKTSVDEDLDCIPLYKEKAPKGIQLPTGRLSLFFLMRAVAFVLWWLHSVQGDTALDIKQECRQLAVEWCRINVDPNSEYGDPTDDIWQAHITESFILNFLNSTLVQIGTDYACCHVSSDASTCGKATSLHSTVPLKTATIGEP